MSLLKKVVASENAPQSYPLIFGQNVTKNKRVATFFRHALRFFQSSHFLMAVIRFTTLLSFFLSHFSETLPFFHHTHNKYHHRSYYISPSSLHNACIFTSHLLSFSMLCYNVNSSHSLSLSLFFSLPLTLSLCSVGYVFNVNTHRCIHYRLLFLLLFLDI